MAISVRPDPLGPHWKALSLQPGAPACVIREAHRYHIRLAHPDVGGSDEEAMRVNVAMDKVGSKGSPANEHVARYVASGEPWHVLGLSPSADPKLVERAGKALAAELADMPRLTTRVHWAVANFTTPAQPPQPKARPRVTPSAPPPRPKGMWVPPPPRAPVVGRPDGLPQTIDFGEFLRGSEAEHVVRLTWPGRAPQDLRVETAAPLVATITPSKTQPGRVALKLAIDWESPLLADPATARGFDARLTVRWGEEGSATIRVVGSPAQPTRIAVGPKQLDFGAVRLKQPARAELTLRSSRPAQVTIDASAWLHPVDGKGRRMVAPIRLDANTPAILTFGVDWAPILDKGADSIAKRRALKPSGRINVRWDGGEIAVPVTMLVEAN